MIIRMLTRSVRGPAKPRQILLATVLGALLAFVPDYREQALYAVAIVLALLVSGANLPLAAIIWLPARLLALVVMPVSFSIGEFLIEGPAHSLFAWLANAPIFALLGFQYYALSGGIPLAVVLGLLLGMTVSRLLSGMRTKLDGLQQDSDVWKRVLAGPLVRALTWIFGGDWRKPEPASLTRVVLRPVIAIVLVGGMVFAVQTAPGPWLRPVLAANLAEWNGATVDLQSVEIDTASGRLTLIDLALADQNNLDRNLFAAARLEADFSTTDLLRGRLTIDSVVAHDAHHGTSREERGVLVGSPPVVRETTEGPGWGDGKSLDDYLVEFREWKERLAQVREWLEDLAGPAEEAAEPTPESIRERLEREVAELGWARVSARGLRTGAPALLIAKLAISGMKSEDLKEDPIDVEAHNISTEPRLVAGAPRVSIRSRSGRIQFEVGLGGVSAKAGENGIDFSCTGLATESLLNAIKLSDRKIVEGGTVDVTLNGEWNAGEIGRIELPLVVTVREASWSLGAGKPVALEAVSFPLGLSGTIDNPRIEFDGEGLRESLLNAGKAELRDRLGDKADSKLDEAESKLKEKAKGILGGLLGED